MTHGLGFGVPQLDKMLPDVPDGASVLVLSDPGVEADAFLYQSAHTRLKEGREVLYVVTNRGPDSVREALDEYGFAGGDGDERLVFIDAFSALMGAKADVPYTVNDPTDLDEVARVIATAVEEHPDALLLVDSLSTVIDNTSTGAFATSFPTLMDAIRGAPMSEVSFIRWPYSDNIERFFNEFDAVLRVKGVEQRVVFSQYFNVERADWAEDASTQPQLFKTRKPGGVFVYIPKIVVTGPYQAGKSTFVHSVSDEAVSVDRMGTTVALDHGHVLIDGLIADVFGTPGQSRFDPILATIAGQALGVIVVVDASKPETFARAKEMMQQTWRQGLPIVIAANKQDLDDALDADAVRDRLDPPEGVPVVPCRAEDRESARTVLRGLIDWIMRGPLVA